MKYSRIFLIASWILVTVSLATWWLIYGLQQINRSETLNAPDAIRAQRMLHWEGGFLILLLLAGGLALLSYSLKEFKRNRQIKEFFATLTHELKTPLASLRLQAESLQEDLSHTEHAKLIDRLMGDASRLELQLENALFLASAGDADQLHIEPLKMASVAETLKHQCPDLKVEIPEDCTVLGDTRALEGILKNLIQNSKSHGQARTITLKALKKRQDVELSVEDDGRGFNGDVRKLGHLFRRPTARSGSGVGLYLAKTLAEKMNGRIEFFDKTKAGFKVSIMLRGGS